MGNNLADTTFETILITFCHRTQKWSSSFFMWRSKKKEPETFCYLTRIPEHISVFSYFWNFRVQWYRKSSNLSLFHNTSGWWPTLVWFEKQGLISFIKLKRWNLSFKINSFKTYSNHWKDITPRCSCFLFIFRRHHYQADTQCRPEKRAISLFLVLWN